MRIIFLTFVTLFLFSGTIGFWYMMIKGGKGNE